MKKQPMQPAGCKGFSLVELLCVLAILLILTVMTTSRGSRSYQQKQLATCEKNLQNIYSALSLYTADNKDAYPFVADAGTSEKPLSLLVPKYTTVTEIFVCPGTKKPPLPAGEPFADKKISYAYYMGLDKSADPTRPLASDQQLDTLQKKAGDQVFSSEGKGTGSNHEKFGGNILLCDGATKRSGWKLEIDLIFPTNVVLLNPKQ